MITIECNITKNKFTVKKICKDRSEVPNNATYFKDAWQNYGKDCFVYSIYIADKTGTLYAIKRNV